MGQPGSAGLFLVALLATGACSGGSGPKAPAAASVKREATTSSSSGASSSSSSSVPTTSPTIRPAAPAAPATTARPPAGTTIPEWAIIVGPAPLDPAELARMVDELVAAETAIRSPATPSGDLAGLARTQQAIYRAISARPESLPQAQERVPEALRPVVEANVTAGVELRALTKPRTELPPWRIVAPPPAEELEGYYKETEARYRVPWTYLAAVHLVESRMGRIRGTSTAGAQGPMQFLPGTWERYGEGGDINDPHDAILAAGRYLEAAGAPGDMAKALYAYNRSERYVRAVTLYATQIEADPRAYLGYYHWQVYYITTKGDVLLEVGYGT